VAKLKYNFKVQYYI